MAPFKNVSVAQRRTPSGVPHKSLFRLLPDSTLISVHQHMFDLVRQTVEHNKQHVRRSALCLVAISPSRFKPGRLVGSRSALLPRKSRRDQAPRTVFSRLLAAGSTATGYGFSTLRVLAI